MIKLAHKNVTNDFDEYDPTTSSGYVFEQKVCFWVQLKRFKVEKVKVK